MPQEQTPTTPAAPSTPASSGTNGAAPATPEPSQGASPEPVESGDTTANVFDGFDFGSMDFAEETGDTVVVDKTKTEQGKPEATAPVTAPAAAPAPQAPVQTPAAAAPAVATPAPQTPAPATATPPGSADAGTEDPVLKAWNENQQKLDTELRNFYALDEATADKLLENPREVMPMLLAKLHQAVLQNTYKTVIDRLPPLMKATAEAVKTHAKNEESFFKAWPVFKQDDPAQMQVLLQYGQLYRTQNPTASEADFIKFVGAAAAAHLGLKMPVTAKGNGKGKPTPYSPAASSAPASGSGEPPPSQMDDFMTAVQSE